MGAEIVETKGSYIAVRLFGKLSPMEYTDVQRSLAGFLQKAEGARILLEAEEFDGWASSSDWAALSISFPLRVDSHIERMAILAAAKWEEDLLAFLGEGHREFPIRRFDPGDREKALKWLETGEEM